MSDDKILPLPLWRVPRTNSLAILAIGLGLLWLGWLGLREASQLEHQLQTPEPGPSTSAPASTEPSSAKPAPGKPTSSE